MDLDGDVGTLDPNFIALNVCVMQLQEYVRRTRGELLKRNVNLKDDAKVNRERHDEQFRILRKMVEEQAETIERLQYEDAQIKKRDRDEITSLQKQVDDLNKRVSRLEQEVVEGKKHGRKLENRIRDAVQPIQAQLDDLNYISRSKTAMRESLQRDHDKKQSAHKRKYEEAVYEGSSKKQREL